VPQPPGFSPVHRSQDCNPLILNGQHLHGNFCSLYALATMMQTRFSRSLVQYFSPARTVFALCQPRQRSDRSLMSRSSTARLAIASSRA
jgi:hypothetical protein